MVQKNQLYVLLLLQCVSGVDVLQEEEARPAKRTRKARKSKAEVDDTDEGPSTPLESKPSEQPEQPVRKKVPGSGSSWSAEDKGKY